MFTKKSLKLTDTFWRGIQPAWLISCNKLELIVTKNGLNIASITHKDDINKINPYWIPSWPWKSPQQCRHLHINGEDEDIYGNREDSQLLTNICGHSICIDRFGICKLSDEPRTCHGEASVIEWDLSEYTNQLISFSTYLPLARLNLKRQFNFDDNEQDTVYITTWIDNASNRYIDFFNTDDNEQQQQEKKREKLNEYTMNDLKQQIAQDKNIGNPLNETNHLNFNSSSFMNLPGNKQERKKTKSRRDDTNLQRTYEITRSYMEDEYRQQIVDNKSNKIKDFLLSPRKFLREKKIKSNISDTAQYDPNQNQKLNDDLINKMYEKQHGTWKETKDEDLALKFKQDDRTRYDVEWCEHITISDPFLNDAQFILPKYATNNNIAYNCPLEMPNSRFNGETEINLNKCLEIPKQDDKDLNITEATACFVDDDYKNNSKDMNETNFIVRNEKLGFELEYEWNSKTWPWLCIWTEHFGTNHVPWNGNERCRGLELSTKPFPIPDLHRELPQNEIKTHVDNDKINLWNDKPIDFVLPNEGRVETFALRWSKI